MIFNKYIRAVIVFATLLYGVNLSAQSPLSTYYLECLPQVNISNPAMMPRANTYISIPSVYAGIHTDLAAEDLLQKQNGQWVTPIDKSFNYDDLYTSIGKSSALSSEISIAPIGFGFRTGERGYFTFSFAEKISARINIASDFFEIADKGLPVNTTLDLSRTGEKLMAYKEISLGYAHKIDEKLTVGIHVKPLFGQVASISEIDNFVIKTGLEEYTLNVKGNIYASAPLEVEEGEDGFADNVEFQDLEDSEYNSKYGSGFKNSGIAFDLGGVYAYSDKIVFSAALNNLGFIKWKEDLHSQSFSGEYKFTGADVGVLTLDSIGEMFKNEMDSITDVLQGETGNKKFSTGLTPSLYIGGQYKVNHAVSLGLLSRSTFEKYNFRQEFNLSANFNPYSFVTASINYNKEINGSSAIGLALALKGGPIQFYIVADHIPFKYHTIEDDGTSYPAPLHMESFSLMTGINFVFGAKGFKNKSMIAHR